MENSAEDKFKEFYIPTYILDPDPEVEQVSSTQVRPPSCPVIVFINSKSGGQLGRELLITYCSVLNKKQVFDLDENAPDKVLHRLYGTLEKLKRNGDNLASDILEKLRIIVAGGDGTASWILGVICDLKLPYMPPVATVPLGTGNNLSFSFGWGKKNPGTDRHSVEVFLEQVKTAKAMRVDSWHILMKMRVPKGGSFDPIALLELPNSLHAFHRLLTKDTSNEDDYQTFRGGFWNYFSMGMDAQVSYAFHSERKLHPEKFRHQLRNQSTYAKLGCKQGWFCAPFLHPSSRNIAQLSKVKIMRKHSHWEELNIPQSIRSIVCLNLLSFSGGFNPWGTPCRQKSLDRGLTPPYVDDGLIEIVGFRDAWHGLVLLAPHGHGTRLAQASRVCFEFHKGAADHAYIRLDGEPWKQPLPLDDDTVVIELSHFGQVTMLARLPCRSKSIHEPSSPHTPRDKGHDSNDDEESDEDWEEHRKFGAANTFRKSDDADLSHLR